MKTMFDFFIGLLTRAILLCNFPGFLIRSILNSVSLFKKEMEIGVREIYREDERIESLQLKTTRMVNYLPKETEIFFQ
jgi:hypothetical protein